MGAVSKIFLRPASRAPLREVASADAAVGAGLVGDHAGGGNRQVTLIGEDRWTDACRELGRDLDPAGRRANIVVSGFPLGESIGRRIRVGGCLIDVIAETRPCKLMDDFAPGLQQALSPDRRGGVYGRVVRGGRIDVGGSVDFAPEDCLPAESGRLEFDTARPGE
jgi:MOSC domain-containing protein YiiM